MRFFKTVMRILRAQEKGRKWLKVLWYAIYLMNNKVSTCTGYSRHELFFRRTGFHMEFLTPQDAIPHVKQWMERQAMFASKAKELLQRIWEGENTRSNPGRIAVEYQIGDMVLVHHKKATALENERPRPTLLWSFYGHGCGSEFR